MATSSRLIVKNLPKHLDEKSLKNHFGTYGKISDAKIIFKGEKNRRFGFVGFIRDEDAIVAQKELHNSYIDTSKLTVGFAITNDQMETDENYKDVLKRKKAQGPTTDKSAYESRKINNELPADDEAKQNLKKRKFDDFLKEMEIGEEQIATNDRKKKVKTDAAQALADSKPVVEKLDTTALDERRLYVTNIPYNIDKDEVRVLFEKYGSVTECITPRDPSGNSRGIAYISYDDPNDAIQSISKLDNKIAFGRILHIKPAFGSRRALYKDTVREYTDTHPAEKSSYKQFKKGAFMKNLDDETSWNTLFLNPNTVMDLISKQMGISKSEMLDKEVDNPAVKIATAETEVINETKEFLKANGINIDIFTSERKECPRSNKIILAKNLSLAMTKKKMMNLFGNYGMVSKCIMPKNRALGIVKFESAEHAANAFKLLSGYNTDGCVLYLEWGPLNIFTEEEDNLAEEKKNQNPLEAGLGVEFDKKPEEAKKEVKGEPEEDVMKIEQVANTFNTEKDPALDKAMTVFVKNLNFSTTEESLSTFLNELGFGPRIKSQKIVTKNGLSAGFGFVEFWDGETASKFIKNHQGVLVDSHS
jgi:multiple RNA-binding domain-containing protein 1